MKEYVLTEKENIVAIADAIRNKIGSTEELSLGEFVENINGITGNGSGGTSNVVTINVSIVEERASTFHYLTSSETFERVDLNYYENSPITINALGGLMYCYYPIDSGNFTSVCELPGSGYCLVYFSPSVVNPYIILRGELLEGEIPLP
jgi:hypothetical protein